MYVTTSRRPSSVTKAFARALGAFVGVYEGRGSKSIDDVAARARVRGCTRVLIIGEERKRPASIAFVRIGKDWEWIDEIKISAQRIPRISPIKKDVKFIGERRYRELFNFPEPASDDFVLLDAKKGKIKLAYGKHKLTIKVIE